MSDNNKSDPIGTEAMTDDEQTPAHRENPLLACFKTLDKFVEQEATWLIPGWMPAGQVTILAGDGGVGKTSLWCNIVAALSSGRKCIFDPPEVAREPQKVAFLTSEDSVSKKLAKKLRLAGAELRNIVTMDVHNDKNGLLQKLSLSSTEFARFIQAYRPALCVIDPIQGFLPDRVNMARRNDMRQCTAPLMQLGEEFGTSFLVICHSNKRGSVFGRARIADSADIWDSARSVLMTGFTGEGEVRYISQEKNNYGVWQETVLYDIGEHGQIRYQGTSWKRDREYMQDAVTARSAPKREDCKQYILRILGEAGDDMPSKTLQEKMHSAGYSESTFRDARDELKASGIIDMTRSGNPRGGDSVWHTYIVHPNVELDLPEALPF